MNLACHLIEKSAVKLRESLKENGPKNPKTKAAQEELDRVVALAWPPVVNGMPDDLQALVGESIQRYYKKAEIQN
mgnify:CR=1 FL=1